MADISSACFTCTNNGQLYTAYNGLATIDSNFDDTLYGVDWRLIFPRSKRSMSIMKETGTNKDKGRKLNY